MSYTYEQRKKASPRAPAAQNAAPERAEALERGMVKPASAEMGHRVDLPDAMRAKMENSFGADLSAVKLYESNAVADAGAEAITQGNSIAFAPGKLDFASEGGQALLGHELSHVVSQQRGEVTGSGFLNDHALEARADREGAMAAAGQQITMPTAALSTASAAPAAGPMQADKTRFTDNLAQKDADKALHHLETADKYRERGDLKKAERYNKKAWKKAHWSDYWRTRGDSQEDREFDASIMGTQVRNHLPIFYKDYYNMSKNYNSGADPEGEKEYREGLVRLSLARHRRDGGFY